MKLSDFDYPLSENLIAKRPARKRDMSRLLVLYHDGAVKHSFFSELLKYLERGDLLVLNNTKVFPARFSGTKENGKLLDIMLVRQREDGSWEIMSKGRYSGFLRISDFLSAEIYDGSIAHLSCKGDIREIMWQYGEMPLPPYLKRPADESDKRTYQCIYAKHEGSIAAPTAGLHFSHNLLSELKEKGVLIRELTLHVGIGTFKPVRIEYIENHCMDSEYFEIDKNVSHEIKAVHSAGKRIVAVGTTTTRALEGFMSGHYTEISDNGKIRGWTDIFIYPGYRFQIVDSLITNFHLPRSTPLMLTAALCGREKLLSTYKVAIDSGYRFLSYGDAMLIL